MSTKDKILSYAKRKSSFRTSELVGKLKISRQSVASHLKTLVEEGVLFRSGSTRSARYRLASKVDVKRQTQLTLRPKIKALREDLVLNEVDQKLGLSEHLNANAYSVFSYAFTEMLNNAIDHSKSVSAKISIWEKKGSIWFEVRDFGVGVFFNVMKKFHLKNEFEGLEHVLKGKQTTAPEAHSGEGIFFTSRVADLFVLRSHKLQTKINNQISDTFVSEERVIKGTSVTFSISTNTKKRLDALFRKHTGDDFKFNRADQRVRISAFGGALSRSQAKRLLFGLEKFTHLTMDFQGVKEIGQAFADEIFRIYVKTHPDKHITYENASEAVAFMIRRAQNG